MKSAIFAVVLLSGTTALAQTDILPPPVDPGTPTPVTPPITDTMPTDPLTPATTPPPAMTAAATGSTAMPGNAAPEHDARGIAVISDAATVPAGYNGTPGTMNGMGGPLLDPANTDATGGAAATPDNAYPLCSRTVTDNCVQAYERGRRR